MRIIVLLLGIYIFASAQSCYTVQILSLPLSKTSEKRVNSESYAKSCQSMKIGNTLTVRCGCFEKYNDASNTLAGLRKKHKNAYVATTYKKRFNVATLDAMNIATNKKSNKDEIKKRQKKNANKVDHKKQISSRIKQEKIILTTSNSHPENSMLVATSETCYSAQVFSLPSNEENKRIIDSKEYDPSCKKMNISGELTVRCGCIDSYKEAEKALPYFSKKYKEAYLVSTYKYRFGKGYVQKQEPLAKVKSSEITTKSKKKKKKKKKSKYSKKKEKKSAYDKYLLPLSGEYQSSALSGRYGSAQLDYHYRFGAQISYDIGYIDEAPNGYDDNGWRRVRMYHKGNFFDEKLFYELEYSITGNNNIKDVFLGYQDKIPSIDANYRIKYGNVKIPFSLETYSSSKYITFMERALTDSFADNRKVGLEVLLSKKLKKDRVNLFISKFENSLNDNVPEDDKIEGYSSRLVYAKRFSKSHILSVGGGIKKINYFGENVKFNQGLESGFTREKYVSVRIKDVETIRYNNAELLYINKAYSLQGEYVTSMVKSLKDGNYDFKAYYLQGSYFIFGSGRRYKMSTSTLSKLLPTRDGSLEFAIRYSYIDLNDRDEFGGTQTDMNYALNWYITKEMKLMLNYVVAKPKGTDEYDGVINIYQARILFAF